MLFSAPRMQFYIPVYQWQRKDHFLVHPNGDEWESMDARVTITTNSDENICAMQKGGLLDLRKNNSKIVQSSR